MKRTHTIAVAAILLFAGLAAPVSAVQGAGSHGQPLAEQIRQATAPFRSLLRARADGYTDLHLFVPGQGFHYINMDLVDATFDPDHPELLVYSPDTDGALHLVAAEYAVVIDDNAPNTPPEGFPGTDDVWERNDDFHVWTLHAWAWRDNPAGFFAPTNPLVP